MSIQYFKRERGGVNPVGAVQPHIYRDPPKGIFTRKYEPVNVADTMYMYQADNPYGDPTRINEAIQMYARGQNPMVEVSYQNAGGASMNSSLGNAQVSNPYKVEVVRPPLQPIETQVPISAPRIHQNYSISTNKSIFPQTIAGEYDKAKVRLMTDGYTNISGNVRSNLNASIQLAKEREANITGKQIGEALNISVAPTVSYNIDSMRDNTTKLVTETKDLLNIASVAPISFTDVVVFDPKSNSNVMVNTNIKERHAIAVTAAASAPIVFNTNDGQIIKLKDYDYKVVQSAFGNSQLLIYVRQPDVKLDRTTPLYAAQSTVSMTNLGDGMQRMNANKLSLESVLPLISATSSISLPYYNEQFLRDNNDPTKYQLTNNVPLTSATASLTLRSLGYNEEQMRQGKHREFNKQAHYSDNASQDRTARANPLLRGLVLN
jgi:hypothetical protein